MAKRRTLVSISAIYDILFSIFQSGRAWKIRRCKLRQSLDSLRQNSPVLWRDESLKRSAIPKNHREISVILSSELRKQHQSVTIFLRKSRLEFAKPTGVGIFRCKPGMHMLFPEPLTGTMSACFLNPEELPAKRSAVKGLGKGVRNQ